MWPPSRLWIKTSAHSPMPMGQSYASAAALLTLGPLTEGRSRCARLWQRRAQTAWRVSWGPISPPGVPLVRMTMSRWRRTPLWALGRVSTNAIAQSGARPLASHQRKIDVSTLSHPCHRRHRHRNMNSRGPRPFLHPSMHSNAPRCRHAAALLLCSGHGVG